MITIPFPHAPRVTSLQGNKAVFVIEGLFPGYGITVANALRRVVLSSLTGGGVVAVKIKDIDHEFSTIPGVIEDMVTILLNIKRLSFRVYEAGVFEGTLSIKGERAITGKDFKFASEVELVNPELPIATLTDKKSELQITVWVTQGIGYELAEEHNVKLPVSGAGILKVDTVFTPVILTSFEVENMRVGDRTDYNRIIFNLETDGTVTPQFALEKGVKTLIEQFEAIVHIEGAPQPALTEKTESGSATSSDALQEVKTKLSTKDIAFSGRYFVANLKLSSRIEKILGKHKVKTIAQLAQKNESELMKMDGIGDAAVKEIKRKLGKAGFLLETK